MKKRNNQIIDSCFQAVFISMNATEVYFKHCILGSDIFMRPSGPFEMSLLETLFIFLVYKLREMKQEERKKAVGIDYCQE